jgi:hypothetical protein
MAGTRTPTLEVEKMAVETSTWRPEPMSERIVVRCYQSYQDAKRAVDTLEVGRIPRKRITVFGRGLRWREAFTAARMVKASALGGAVLAGAVGLILWSLGALDSGFTWLTGLVAGAALGGVVGLALGAVAWTLTSRDRSIPETGHVDVDHYEVLVEVDHADRARELLDRHTSAD